MTRIHPKRELLRLKETPMPAGGSVSTTTRPTATATTTTTSINCHKSEKGLKFTWMFMGDSGR